MNHPATLQSSEKQLLRLVVQSSDVLSDMRINVLDESTSKVIWYKERYLSEDEIVENIVENDTSTIVWSIHRPALGWYIRIRTPTFPPGFFIPLLPVSDKAPYYTPAALSFSCRTNVPRPPALRSRTQSMETDVTLNDDASPSANHSYPPTPPPALVIEPPSPSEVQAKLAQIVPQPSSRADTLRSSQRTTGITQLYLTPIYFMKQPQVGQSSFLSRTLSLFKSSASDDSKSFGLYPAEPIARSTAGIRVPPTSTTVLPTHQTTSSARDSCNTPAPLLTFHDHTSVFTVRSLTGSIEIDQTLERMLGVQRSFWVAVALTYLQFLDERESYLAAISD